MMKLEIISPEKTYFKGEVDSVTLPGVMGPFQILNNHAPLISLLTKGMLVFSTNGHIKEMEITDGFVEVSNNNITVCIDPIKKKVKQNE
ncbi:MAG: ATP synthase F1 subunit epsilon [Fermentimonas sp.]|nr:ATP synthase F1 subunit epsilon [Fermentimonas sp.]MDD4696014.1 ATP synthase F1 subunit epsilon [Fermentimonas sp.]